ncbi:MAG: hypothetical protein WDA53_02995 [Bacillota bacterium]
METHFPEILLPIKNELELVAKNINEGMMLKAGHVSEFAKLELHWCDEFLHPAVLILSARMFDYRDSQIITMATAMQFLYLGTGIHFGKYDQRLGLPVLIGDYFYSKFFSYMCQQDSLKWLTPTANAVCDVHIAGIREKEEAQLLQSNSNEYIKTLQEQMSLLGFCASFGALVVKAEKKYFDALVSFGKKLGAGIQLIRNKELLNLANQLLTEAKQELEKLPNKSEKVILFNIVEHCLEARKKIDLVS